MQIVKIIGIMTPQLFLYLIPIEPVWLKQSLGTLPTFTISHRIDSSVIS